MELSRELIYPEKRCKVVGGVISKGYRFSESLTDASVTASLDYNPNYDLKYKKAAAVVIKKEENLEQAKKRKKEKMRMLLPELITSEKFNLSVLTADTTTTVFVGPGAYAVNYRAIETTRNVGLSKASRFEPLKKDDALGLNVCYDQIEKNAKGAVMRPPTLINSKLIRKKKDEIEQEQTRAQRELALLKERERKNNEEVKQVVQVREKTEKERLIELFRLVDKINHSLIIWRL